VSAAFGTPAMRYLAQHIYFRRRGGAGVSFADFEERLAGIDSKEPAATTGVFR
jgi:digeranylgeranylglycerophospholipid reductase